MRKPRSAPRFSQPTSRKASVAFATPAVGASSLGASSERHKSRKGSSFLGQPVPSAAAVAAEPTARAGAEILHETSLEGEASARCRIHI